MDIKNIAAGLLGFALPAFEWASKNGLDGFEVLKHEWETFIAAPDISHGITETLTNTTDMPISTIAQYVGIGNEAAARIVNKNLLGKYRKPGLYFGVGSFLTRLAMFGSHGSPALPESRSLPLGVYSV